MIKRLLCICIFASAFSFSAMAQQSGVPKVTDDSFDALVLKSKLPVVVQFDADWCGPCRLTAPILNDLAGEMGGVKFMELDVDQSPKEATINGVISIPTLLIFKDGTLVSRQVGAAPKDKIEQWVKSTTGN